MSGERYLLDTHVWVWLMTTSPSLKAKHRDLLEEAQRRGALYLSTISVWEVARLESEGRMFTTGGVETWMGLSFDDGALHPVELSARILIASARLPGEVHGDPADRLLVATAREMGLTLMTHDDKLLRYANQGHLRVHKV